MDDLYANAWSDPSESSSSGLKSSTSTSTGWLSPRSPDVHEEADLAAPSWSTGDGIRWNEPSDDAGFSWAQTDSDLAWGTNTYEHIRIARPVGSVIPEDLPPEQEQEEQGGEAYTSLPSLPPEAATSERESPPSSLVQDVVPPPINLSDTEALSPPIDHDGFGTFESAIAPDEDSAIVLDNGTDTDAWGSAWANAADGNDSQGPEPVDEWEAARQRKAQQDQRVPPTVVAAILKDCQQFCEDTLPHSGDAEVTDEDDWRNNWRRGLGGVEGLESLVETFLPPLSLQPPVKFGKTATAKRLAASVRLTKNMAMTKGSPLSHYLAAKGSTAWELAVRERREVVEDDIPVGWRVLDRESTSDALADSTKEKRTATSRLFSFWGRRETGTTHTRSSSSVDINEASRPQSPKSPVSGDRATHSRQPSGESVRLSPVGNVDQSAPSMRQTTAPPAPSLSATSPTSIASAPTQGTSYANAPEPQFDPSTTQAPSAVSRFLNRFSRRGSAVASGSPKNSLALSSDDLEFLADIPSANDDRDDEDKTGLKALTDVFDQKPTPPVPPPPAETNARSNVTASQHTPMDSMDSTLGLLDSTAFTAASDTSTSVNVAALQSVPTIPILQPPRSATPPVPITAPTTGINRPALSSPVHLEAKASSQPFFLPSPPSSRSHTPIFNVKNTSSNFHAARSSTPPVKLENAHASSSSRSSRPFFPPPRAMATATPPPDETANPPDTPTSAMPLAQLYPDAYRAQTTSKSVSRSQATTPLISPPPPARSHIGGILPLLAPPPAVSKQLSAPPMLAPSPAIPRLLTTSPAPPPKPPPLPLASFDMDADEEEFSDFLSSATVPTSSKPIVRTIATPTRSSTPSHSPPSSIGRSGGKAPALAHLRIGSSSQRSVSRTSPNPPKLSLLDDDDDQFSQFSQFRESPATAQHQPGDGFSDLSLLASNEPPHSRSNPPFRGLSHSDSTTPEKAFVVPSKTPGFDFLNSYSSPRTPSPPRPMSKTATSHTSGSSQSLSLSRKGGALSSRQKDASQAHTLSLMEMAASRPGQWPAPSSPLPPVIPAPPSRTATSVDLLGDDGSPARPKYEGLTESYSLPAVMNPIRPASAAGLGIGPVSTLPSPFSQSQSLQGTSLASLQKADPSPALAPPTAPAGGKPQTSKTGGLSAQDLMFFEGL